jgi:hypothetical protein
MTPVRIAFEPSGQVSELAYLLREMDADPSVGALMVLSCDANGYVPETLDPELKKIGKPIVGGIFPGILHDARRYELGSIVVGLPFALIVCISSRLDTDDLQSDAIWEGMVDIDLPGSGSAIVFLDALAGNIETAIGALYDELGMDIRCIGGGAGSLSFVPKPCVITNQGLLQGVGIVGIGSAPIGVGVTHGWQPIADSVQVTESSGNRLQSLNWVPALEWYREAVLSVSSVDLDTGNFFDIAKSYPLGILSLGGELVVRDLLNHDEQTLIAVCGIPVNAMVRVLHGDVESLLASAGRCQELARKNLGEPMPVGGLVMDCISRALFLGDQLDEELRRLWSAEFPVVGALTIGEITADGQRALEFHNKTTALGCFGHGE